MLYVSLIIASAKAAVQRWWPEPRNSSVFFFLPNGFHITWYIYSMKEFHQIIIFTISTPKYHCHIATFRKKRGKPKWRHQIHSISPGPSTATRNNNLVEHSLSVSAIPSNSLIYSLCFNQSFILSVSFSLFISFFCLIHSFSFILSLPAWSKIIGFHSEHSLLRLSLFTILRLKHWTNLEKHHPLLSQTAASVHLLAWRHQGFARLSGVQVCLRPVVLHKQFLSNHILHEFYLLMRINERCHRYYGKTKMSLSITYHLPIIWSGRPFFWIRFLTISTLSNNVCTELIVYIFHWDKSV